MQLFVVRHGDSPFTAATDHQRPLSSLGQAQAIQSGQFIAANMSHPFARIVCSDALRTATTARLVADQLADSSYTEHEELYGARTGQWCDVMLRNASCEVLILVGHNPTMSLLARHLYPLHDFHFQPACVACFTLEIDQDGLRLPAQYNAFFSPHAKQ
jgi:phosphohistidine phosphatase